MPQSTASARQEIAPRVASGGETEARLDRRAGLGVHAVEVPLGENEGSSDPAILVRADPC